MASRRLLTTLLTAAAALSCTVGQIDAQNFEGKKVTDVDVRYTGSRSVDEAKLRNFMGVAVGQKYSTERLDDDVKSLYESGLVEDVTFLAEEFNGGVRIIAQVDTRDAQGGIGFTGNESFSEKKLASISGMSAGEPLSDANILTARRKLEEHYQGFGFADSSVTYRLQETAQPGVSDLIFVIDEGGKSIVRKILFEGNTAFTDVDLRKEMSTKEKGFFSFLTNSGQIDGAILSQDVDKVLNYYRDRGYVRVSSPGPRRENVQGEKVDLIIPINEGAKYTVGKVSFGKMSVFSAAELAPVLTLNAGDPYSGKKMRADIKTIRRYYGSKGYADAQPIPSIKNAGPNQVSIVYNITEGRRYKVGRVNITGNTTTQDRVIRREVPLKPGDNFNSVDLDTTRSRLENMNYFSTVSARGVESSQAGYRDIDIRLDEKKTGSVSFGLGFSSIDSVVGFINLEQTNFDIKNAPRFTGGGQRFSANLRVGGERQELSLKLVEPWFLGQRLSLGGEVFYQSAQFFSDSYEQANLGAAVSLRKPVDEHSHIALELRVEQIDIEVDSDVPDGTAAAPNNIRSGFIDEEGDFFRTLLTASYVYDDRDSFLLPRSGGKYSFGIGLAGLLGGDVDTYNVNASGIRHWNLRWDTILTLNGEFNVTDETGSGDVPIFARHFIGGARNLRGFEFRDVGPRDAVTGDSLGGRTSAFASLEYTFPLVERVRGAVFYDMGFVNEDAWDFSASELHSDIGLGLRLFLPFGPLALDYAVPVESPDEEADQGGQFNFYLNYQF